jgi:hypothetical protein
MGEAKPKRVRVLHGVWKGRVGTQTGVHTNVGGTIQQSQTYPIVKLDAEGRKMSRFVRVLAVEEID